MSSVKISELSSVSEVLGTDESPVVQSSTTKKFSMTQLGSYILNGFSSLSLGGVTRTAKAAIDAIATALSTLTSFVGSTSMGTTATTVTGAIAEHEGDITSINSNLNDLTVMFAAPNLNIGYTQGESVMAKVKRAYDAGALPKNKCFVAHVISGSHWVFVGYFYSDQSYGSCLVLSYQGVKSVQLNNGTWSEHSIV